MTYLSDSLAGMRVLVTRPKPLGDALCAAIEASGGHAVYFPVIDILPSFDNTKNISQLQEFDWLIFISPQAVLQTAKMLHQQSLDFPTQVKVAALGAGTAQTLRDEKFPVDVFPKQDWHSEGLLDLPEFQNIHNKKIAIISGENGRTFLMDELTRRGASVTKIIVYRRALPALPKRLEKVDIMVCTSSEGVTNLKKLFSDKKILEILETPLLVISERMVLHARELGFVKIFLAKNASHHAILTALASVKGVVMDKQTDEKNSQRRLFPWASIGILFSGLSVVVLIFVAYFAYYSLFFLNKNMLDTVSSMQKNMQLLQQNVNEVDQHAQQWGDEIKNQAQAITALQQTQTSNKDVWTLLEAQYLAKLASDNLQFESNVPTAITLLQTADKQLQNLTDPKVTVIRQALASDIAALQSLPQVDVVGVYSRLSALSDQVYHLPLPVNTVNQNTQQSADQNNQSWWKRGLQQTWHALRQIVVVRYNPNGTLPLMTPAQQDFLYENLHAALEKSMWALLHKQPDIYRASLQQAINWTKKYFIQDAPTTQAMLTNLIDLQKTDVGQVAPKTLTCVGAFQDYFTVH